MAIARRCAEAVFAGTERGCVPNHFRGLPGDLSPDIAAVDGKLYRGDRDRAVYRRRDGDLAGHHRARHRRDDTHHGRGRIRTRVRANGTRAGHGTENAAAFALTASTILSS